MTSIQQTSRSSRKRKSATSHAGLMFWRDVKTEADLWAKAQMDARAIMGREPHRPHWDMEWKADHDPLAWWFLTELLMGYAKAGSRMRVNGEST